MSSKRLRIQFALAMLAAMFALWVFRLKEGFVEISGLLLIWLSLPIVAFACGLLLRKRPIAGSFFVLNAMYCGIYALSCLRCLLGDTGNNLPLLFVPLLLFIVTCLVIPALAFHEWTKRRLSRQLNHEGNDVKETKQ